MRRWFWRRISHQFKRGGRFADMDELWQWVDPCARCGRTHDWHDWEELQSAVGRVK